MSLVGGGSGSGSSSSEPSSSRSAGILQRNARNAAGRLAGAKRTSGNILALAERRSMPRGGERNEARCRIGGEEMRSRNEAWRTNAVDLYVCASANDDGW